MSFEVVLPKLKLDCLQHYAQVTRCRDRDLNLINCGCFIRNVPKALRAQCAVEIFGKIPDSAREIEPAVGRELHQVSRLEHQGRPNESRISCVLERPQSRKHCSASRGRSGTTASCAC